MTVAPTETTAEPGVSTVEPGNSESKEASYLRDVAVLRRLEAALAATGAALQAGKEPLLSRVPFTNLTYRTGFTSTGAGQLQYARVDQQIFLRGGAHRTAGDFTASPVTVADLPEFDPNGQSLRPLVVHRFVNYGTLGRIGRVNIGTDGSINIAVPDNSSAEATSSEFITGISGEDAHSHTVDLEQPFDWLSCNTTYLRL